MLIENLKKFRYRTNEFSLRSGFLEETYTNHNGLSKRIQYWKYTLNAYFQPVPGEKLGLYFSHTVFDFFAIVMAALDLRLSVTVENDNDVNYVLHTLPEKDVEKFRISKKPMYHMFDIADDFLPKNCEISTTGQPLDIAIDNLTQQDLLKSSLKSDKFSGTVLHTRYRTNKELIDFLFPTLLGSKTTLHVASGFNDINYGMDILKKIVQKIEIDHVLFSESHIAHKFYRDIDDEKKIAIWTFDPALLKIDLETNFDKLIKGVDFDCEKFTNIAYTYKIDGKFFVDYAYQKIYFGSVEPFEKSIMDVKKKVLEKMIKSYHSNLQIDKFSHTGYIENNFEAIEYFRMLDI